MVRIGGLGIHYRAFIGGFMRFNTVGLFIGLKRITCRCLE